MSQSLSQFRHLQVANCQTQRQSIRKLRNDILDAKLLKHLTWQFAIRLIDRVSLRANSAGRCQCQCVARVCRPGALNTCEIFRACKSGRPSLGGRHSAKN